MASLDEEVANILSLIVPSQVVHNHRMTVYLYISKLLQRCLNGSLVLLYGSVPLRTYLPDGDMDVCFFDAEHLLHHENEHSWFPRVRKALLDETHHHRDGEFSVRDVVGIDADVKIVKCVVDGLQVDISANQIGGVTSVCMLEQVDALLGCDHLFKRSLLLIKAWCYYDARILGSHHSLLATYALETLVLSIFNWFHSRIRTPLQALSCFLHEFSTFEWNSFCVSLLGKIPISAVSLEKVELRVPQSEMLLPSNFLMEYQSSLWKPTFPKTFGVKFLNILDPLDEFNNLGRSVSKASFSRIQRAFKTSYASLTAILRETNQLANHPWISSGAEVPPTTCLHAQRRSSLGAQTLGASRETLRLAPCLRQLFPTLLSRIHRWVAPRGIAHPVIPVLPAHQHQMGGQPAPSLPHPSTSAYLPFLYPPPSLAGSRVPFYLPQPPLPLPSPSFGLPASHPPSHPAPPSSITPSTLTSGATTPTSTCPSTPIQSSPPTSPRLSSSPPPPTSVAVPSPPHPVADSPSCPTSMASATSQLDASHSVPSSLPQTSLVAPPHVALQPRKLAWNVPMDPRGSPINTGGSGSSCLSQFQTATQARSAVVESAPGVISTSAAPEPVLPDLPESALESRTRAAGDPAHVVAAGTRAEHTSLNTAGASEAVTAPHSVESETCALPEHPSFASAGAVQTLNGHCGEPAQPSDPVRSELPAPPMLAPFLRNQTVLLDPTGGARFVEGRFSILASDSSSQLHMVRHLLLLAHQQLLVSLQPEPPLWFGQHQPPTSHGHSQAPHPPTAAMNAAPLLSHGATPAPGASSVPHPPRGASSAEPSVLVGGVTAAFSRCLQANAPAAEAHTAADTATAMAAAGTVGDEPAAAPWKRGWGDRGVAASSDVAPQTQGTSPHRSKPRFTSNRHTTKTPSVAPITDRYRPSTNYPNDFPALGASLDVASDVVASGDPTVQEDDGPASTSSVVSNSPRSCP